jgi:hypothetical protein
MKLIRATSAVAVSRFQVIYVDISSPARRAKSGSQTRRLLMEEIVLSLAAILRSDESVAQWPEPDPPRNGFQSPSLLWEMRETLPVILRLLHPRPLLVSLFRYPRFLRMERHSRRRLMELYRLTDQHRVGMRGEHCGCLRMDNILTS